MLKKIISKCQLFYKQNNSYKNYYFSSNTQQKIFEEKSKEPKWMKFFKDSSPLQIDLERSIKSDNRILLSNYIKTSYTQFNFQQLILSLPNIQKTDALPKIIQQIKMKIIYDQQNELMTQKKETMLYFIKNCLEICIREGIITKFLIYYFVVNFDQFNIIQQNEIVRFFFIINQLTPMIIPKYLNFLQTQNEQQIIQIINDLQPEQFFLLINNLQQLYQIMPIKEFNNFLNNKVIDILYEKLCENLSKLHENQIIIPQNEIEKALCMEIPHFFNLYQIQQCKQLIVNLQILFKYLSNFSLKERYDLKNNLGKYIFYKFDKSVFRIIRDNFEISDRFLIQDVLLLLGNFLQQNQSKDLKFDYKLFPFLLKFNFAYKYYLDEALISLRNIQKALTSQLKRIKDQNSQSLERVDHQLAYMIFGKWKIYHDLNYIEIQEDNSEYQKQIWQQIILDLKDNFLQYLTLLNNDSKFFNQLMKNILSQKIEKEQEKIEDIQNDSDDELSINLQPQQIKNEKDKTKPQKFQKENNDEEDLKEISYKIMEELNPLQEMKEQLNEEQQYELLKKDLNQKMQFYEIELEKLNVLPISVYTKKINKLYTIYLKQFMNIIEIIPSILVDSEDMLDQKLVTQIQFLFNKPECSLLCNQFIFFPALLESVINIIDFKKSDNLQLVPDEMKQNFLNVKQEINQIFNTNNDMEKMVDYLEQQSLNYEQLLIRDKAFQEINVHDELINNSFFTDEKTKKENKLRLQKNPQNLIQPVVQLDHSNERYVYNRPNLIKKLLLTQPMRIIMNESQLKKIVAKTLDELQIKYIKNYVDFPFIGDFYFPQKQIIVQILDYHKLLSGVDNKIIGYYKRAEHYFKQINIQIIYIDYSQYDVSRSDFQENLINKLK